MAGEAADGNGWLAVEVSSATAATGGERSSGLAVWLPSGQRIEVSRGFDAGTLQRLLLSSDEKVRLQAASLILTNRIEVVPVTTPAR